MRLRLDKVRNVWSIQAPEKMFVLDAPSHAIASRCTGETTVERIVEELHSIFSGADRDTIAEDVISQLQDFVDKGVVEI